MKLFLAVALTAAALLACKDDPAPQNRLTGPTILPCDTCSSSCIYDISASQAGDGITVRWSICTSSTIRLADIVVSEGTDCDNPVNVRLPAVLTGAAPPRYDFEGAFMWPDVGRANEATAIVSVLTVRLDTGQQVLVASECQLLTLPIP